MKKLTHILITLLVLFQALISDVFSQGKTNLNLQFKNAGYSSYVIKIDTTSIKKFSLTPNYVGLLYKDFIFLLSD